MTLRARLTLILFVVLAAGLVSSAVALDVVLRAELLRRVDAQLREVESVARSRLAPKSNATAQGNDAVAPPDGNVQVARIDRQGSVVNKLVSPLAEQPDSLEAIPIQLLRDARDGHPRRKDVSINGHPYRVRVSQLPGSSDVLAVIVPLNDVNATMSRLRGIGVLVGVALLAVGSGAVWWLVGAGLRPLEDMVGAADAVASGDVTRRVRVDGGPSREATHLADALNRAFDAQQRSEETLRRFVTDASHELRTPLTSIRGYAELQRSGAMAEPADAARAIDRIEGEAVRMSALVDDLLTLARMDQDLPVQRGGVDLAAVGVDAVADTHAAHPDRSVVLVAPEPVVVLGAEDQIRQVLANLLTNACRHTPAGTAVELAVRISAGEGLVEVTDDGDGLSPEAIEHVFDRFWREDKARAARRDQGGSGLGLSIVDALVTAHGGSVRAENVTGRGARFTVSFPLTVSQPIHRQP